MSLYSRFVLPTLVDLACSAKPTMRQREKAIPMAQGGGCHLNRPIPRLIEGGGFRIQEMQASYISGWRPASFNYWGVATCP